MTILLFVFDQPATGLITVSSVVIAVIGFALRNVISDLFSGIALGVDHPYRIGDWIETTQSSGKVSEITWRTTRLIDRNGFVIIVPNGLVAGQRLINYGAGERDYRTALRVPLERRCRSTGETDTVVRRAGCGPGNLRPVAGCPAGRVRDGAADLHCPISRSRPRPGSGVPRRRSLASPACASLRRSDDTAHRPGRTNPGAVAVTAGSAAGSG